MFDFYIYHISNTEVLIYLCNMKKCILKAHAIKDDSHREILYDCAKCRIQTEGMYFFYFPPWTANLWGSTVQYSADTIGCYSSSLMSSVEEITQKELLVIRLEKH